MTTHRFWIVRCLCICFWLGAGPGIPRAEAGPKMGLVAAGSGWIVQNQGIGASSDDHLFWTSDDGNNWKDITPRDPASKEVAGVFFLDASRGWVLLAVKREPPKSNQEPDDLITDIRGFDLASTTDGGADWTIKHLDSLPEGVGWLAASEIFFLDATHGWMNIESPVPHWGGEGVLLATTDGGSTWKQIAEVNGGGGYGPIRFTDPLNGWIAGGPGGQYLYVTNDGGRHWKKAAVSAPTSIPGEVSAQYSLPQFTDAAHGFLAVKYSGPGKSEEGVEILALFSTKNGGHTWRSESSANLDQAANFPIVAVIGSTALAPKRVDHEPATLLKLGPAGKVSETRASQWPAMPSGAGLLSVNFSDVAHGWASSSDGRLLSTSDGGVTWNDISPVRKKTSLVAPSSIVSSESSSGTTSQGPVATSAALGTLAASSIITTYKSRHLGFDACAAPAQNSRSPQMATWWASSPYFDVGIYVGGSNRSCPQPNLTSSWISAVTSEGWGLMPLWPGPQAPCTSFASTISTTGGAYAQGQAEADAATKGSKSAMAKLGLGAGSVIYYDIENYTPSATCNGNPTGSYVNSFLSGWASEIHANGYITGVYGNTAPASTWYAGGTGYGAVSPSPDDVWIANYNNPNSNLTIWGLSSAAGSLPDAAWPQDQRMRQYLANQSPMWGGLSLNVDNDIEDADVVGGNGSKSYSFSYTTIDYPGAYATYAYGINNAGQIVGQYTDLQSIPHGYLDTAGSFTTIDFPGAADTEAFGINNAGSVVGLYYDQTGRYHGFLYQAGSYTSLDYPNASNTWAFGINDDNQVSGYYHDAAGNEHGFQYQAGTFFSFSCPGSANTDAQGTNGDAQIGGGCGTTSQAFLYACWPFPNCANGGTFSYYPSLTVALAVNNNEQITGASGGNWIFLHEGISEVIVVPGAPSTNPMSANDFTMQNSQGTAKVAVVGYYGGNGVSGQASNGFVATSP